MELLMTGATGFLGRALTGRLLERGHLVRILTRDPSRAEVPGVAHAYPWDPPAGPPPAEAVSGVDAVVHLAGEPVAGRWTRRKRAAIRDSRVQGTAHLVQALRAASPRPAALISASAIGFYGDRGDEPLPEQATPGDDFLAQVCQGWEAEAVQAEPLGLRVARIRIGLVLHPEGGALAAMLPTFRRGLGGRLGSGKQWWSWIHRDDLLSLLVWASENDVRGPVNAVAPTPVTQAEFAQTLARALGRRTFLPAPGFALRLGLGAFSTELLSSKRCEPQVANASGFRFEHPSLQDALADLLREPVP